MPWSFTVFQKSHLKWSILGNNNALKIISPYHHFHDRSNANINSCPSPAYTPSILKFSNNLTYAILWLCVSKWILKLETLYLSWYYDIYREGLFSICGFVSILCSEWHLVPWVYKLMLLLLNYDHSSLWRNNIIILPVIAIWLFQRFQLK